MAKESVKELSFLQHLEILRWHLVRSFIAIFIMGGLAFFAKNILFDVIIFGPKDPSFITYRYFCQITSMFTKGIFCLEKMPFEILNTKMAGQFSTHIWISMIAGFILAFPYILWEVWKFVAPGLYDKERRYSRQVLIFAGFLFAIGVVFGYFIIVPLSVQFLGSYTISSEITNFIDLNSYISTVSTVVLSAGLLFELPIIVYFLARLGLITPQQMKTYRRHAIVSILILSAIITPPDISSQVLVTLPILVLYELSIKICARVVKQEAKRKKEVANP